MLRRLLLIILCCALLSGPTGIAAVAYAEDTAQQQKADKQASDEKLKELNRKMNDIAADTRKHVGEARDEINRLYDDFKKKQGGSSKELEEMRKATNESWDKVKASMDKAIEDLNHAYERAASKGKEKEKEKGKEEAPGRTQ